MKSAIREKIKAQLAGRGTVVTPVAAPALGERAVALARQIIERGEPTHTLQDVARVTGLCPNKVAKDLRGREGFLRTGPGRRAPIRITQTLFVQYVAEAVARGLREVA